MAVKKIDETLEQKEQQYLFEQHDALCRLNKKIIDYSYKRMADIEKNRNDGFSEHERMTLDFMLKLTEQTAKNLQILSLTNKKE